MTVDLTPSGPRVLVVLARQLPGPTGGPINDDELVRAGAVAVNFFVDRSVDGLGADDIEALVGPGDGRRVVARVYAEQLRLFATEASGALVVTRTRRGRSYLVGRLTSSYTFSPGLFAGHPHVRSVDWLGSLPPAVRPGGPRYWTVRSVVDPGLAGAVVRAAEGLTASRCV